MNLNADVLRFMVPLLTDAFSESQETPLLLFSQVVRLRRVCKLWNQTLAFSTVTTYFEVVLGSLRVSFYLGGGNSLPLPLPYLPLYPHWQHEYQWWMDSISITEIARLLKGEERWIWEPSPVSGNPCISRVVYKEQGYGICCISLHLGNLNLLPPVAPSAEEMLDKLLPSLVTKVFLVEKTLTEIDAFDRLVGVYLLEDGHTTFLCYLMDSGGGTVQEPNNIRLEEYEPSKLAYMAFHEDLKFSVLFDHYSDWEFRLARRLEPYVASRARVLAVRPLT